MKRLLNVNLFLSSSTSSPILPWHLLPMLWPPCFEPFSEPSSRRLKSQAPWPIQTGTLRCDGWLYTCICVMPSSVHTRNRLVPMTWRPTLNPCHVNSGGLTQDGHRTDKMSWQFISLYLLYMQGFFELYRSQIRWFSTWQKLLSLVEVCLAVMPCWANNADSQLMCNVDPSVL